MTRCVASHERGSAKVIIPALAALLVSGYFLAHTWAEAEQKPDPLPIPQVVIDDPRVATNAVVNARTGEPVPNASVTVLDGTTDAVRAGTNGTFDLELSAPRLVRVSAQGFAPEVLAAAPGQPFTVGMMPRTDDSVSLRFAGDVMLGRRFYEPTDVATAWLNRGADVAAHRAPLANLAPLLADADLTVVNLETSLIARPYFRGTRPARFNQEKDLVFASAPETAAALRAVGVDVVDLGNNHVYDTLGAGLDSTIAAVESAGLVHFGAGHTVAQAWAPAYVEVRGQRIAFLGCTTVTGRGYRDEYVASATQGGAAECDETRMRETVTAAAAQADSVVVMMHGGTEYRATQDEDIRALSEVATAAGATAVVNGHPHVVGGFTESNDAIVAETMGNMLFDQNLWSTLRSYLLRVDLADGRAVRSRVDPFAMVGYAPVPTTGLLADSSARAAAGLVEGPMLLGVGGAGTIVPGLAGPTELAGSRGDIATIPPGLWLAPEQTAVSPGQDLLFGTGSFERMDTGPETTQPLLWGLGKYTQISSDAACAGGRGLHLARKPGSEFDVIATPLHRLPVAAGDRLTLAVDVRSSSPGAVLELRFYDAFLGSSTKVHRVAIELESAGEGCRQFSMDVTVPAGVVAAQPYLRLLDPGDNTAAVELLADNARLVRWSEAGEGGRGFDTVRFLQSGAAHLVTDRR
jgi:poly-gamma-glutamate synthesis protein (capsule biosynthesis protein)